MERAVKPAGVNENTGFLKIIAVLAMFVDHTAAVFFPGQLWLRVIGRLAFPLFAWSIAVGAQKTRNIRKYALRLLVVGVISQPFYMIALHHELTKLNIFAVLLLGLIGCWGLKEQKYHLTVMSLLVAAFLYMDYGIKGVFLVLLFYALGSQPMWLAIAFGAFCVFWGQSSLILVRWGDIVIRLQTCAILALPLILYPSQKQWKLPKWFWYAVYPGHLAVLSILEKLI